MNQKKQIQKAQTLARGQTKGQQHASRTASQAVAAFGQAFEASGHATMKGESAMSGLSGLSGPMFEPAEWGGFRSIHNQSGAHYNTYEFHSMDALREFFPKGADTMNFVLFSTSGVHGTYTTIEDIEVSLTKYGADPLPDDADWPEDYHTPSLTVLIVQPRIVCLRYGCVPVTLADIPWLKALRQSSWEAAVKVGAAEGQ